MVEDEMLSELYRIKDSLGERFATAHALAEEARRVATAEPLPPAGTQRKLIPGFPKGRSVADPDPVMDELYRTKEELAKRFPEAVHPARKQFQSAVREDKAPTRNRRSTRKTSAKFRTAKSDPAVKSRRH
jgi:hypothetical protein